MLSVALRILAFLFPSALIAASSPNNGKVGALLSAHPSDFRATMAEAKRIVFPTVVYIRCIVEKFDTGRMLRQPASGSGVVVSGDGEVVTNWHVVNQAVEVRCLLNDGRAFTADIVGSDKDTDLALLRLRLAPGETVPFSRLANGGSLQEGDFVMALGAPWGLNRSISFGIIACVRRYLPQGSEYSTWLQTDAAISPGNSGGPLVNTEGRIVGINARGALEGGNLGFAIPAETIAVVLPRLREFGEPNWTWTGLQLQPLRDFEHNIYFDGTDGLIIAGTDEASPAREVGLRVRDRLLRINGKAVTALMEEDLPDVRRQLALLPVDKPATLTVRRDGNELDIVIQPRSKGRVHGEEFACPRWDFSLKAINQFEVPELHFHHPSGLYVSGVRYPGNAQGSGLQMRDILLRANGLPVANIDDARRLNEQSLASLKNGGPQRLILSILRNGQPLQVVVDLSRDFSAR